MNSTYLYFCIRCNLIPDPIFHLCPVALSKLESGHFHWENWGQLILAVSNYGCIIPLLLLTTIVLGSHEAVAMHTGNLDWHMV